MGVSIVKHVAARRIAQCAKGLDIGLNAQFVLAPVALLAAVLNVGEPKIVRIVLAPNYAVVAKGPAGVRVVTTMASRLCAISMLIQTSSAFHSII